eukprot:scaffold3178_cov109-Isochrysis_galbana.AAC.2
MPVDVQRVIGCDADAPFALERRPGEPLTEVAGTPTAFSLDDLDDADINYEELEHRASASGQHPLSPGGLGAACAPAEASGSRTAKGLSAAAPFGSSLAAFAKQINDAMGIAMADNIDKNAESGVASSNGTHSSTTTPSQNCTHLKIENRKSRHPRPSGPSPSLRRRASPSPTTLHRRTPHRATPRGEQTRDAQPVCRVWARVGGAEAPLPPCHPPHSPQHHPAPPHTAAVAAVIRRRRRPPRSRMGRSARAWATRCGTPRCGCRHHKSGVGSR